MCSSPPEPGLLDRFVDSFQRAVRLEMEAIRRSLGPFEVELRGGRLVPEQPDTPAEGGLYAFEIVTPTDKLVPGGECLLRSGTQEHAVVLTVLERDRLELQCPARLGPAGTAVLVIYPWFLYERLVAALEEVRRGQDFHVDTAMALFARRWPVRRATPLLLPHAELNASQRAAVQLCSDSEVAFVWGPPGTGKTVTLAHTALELLAQGQRLLVVSTTNAAVDQALARLAEMPQAEGLRAQGAVVRLGQAQEPTWGFGLTEVVARLGEGWLVQRRRLQVKERLARQRATACRALLAAVEAALARPQMELFAAPAPPIPLPALRAVYSERHSGLLLAGNPEALQTAVRQRLGRLERLAQACAARAASLGQQLRGQEALVVERARLVLATMTGVYLSRLLAAQRFDAVIVEEAGMAVLPVLFYCAALARQRVVMVGDPRQLLPIVQSAEPYVRQAMGRDIFGVAVPDPLGSDRVALLRVQYRMHPVIGEVVSQLFYAGRLEHAPHADGLAALVAQRPFPGHPLVVVDTGGRTRCRSEEGSRSRLNEESARLAVGLAAAAARSGLRSVAVITPYVAQAGLCRQLLAALGVESAAVNCSTVHRFQGHEVDGVVLDLADALPLSPGVLLDERVAGSAAANLLNVSISRARAKLVIVGDVAYFRRAAPDGLVSRLLQRACAAGLRADLSAATEEGPLARGPAAGSLRSPGARRLPS
ncbi:MAG: AAA domain-containing protein [Candidatus Latescibacterota bacterium]